MYRMLYNDNFLFDPFDETRIVSSASITTNVNAASYLDFTIAANHPLYNEIEQRSGIITLYSDNEKLFQGQITAIDMDMDGNKSVTCSSALDWLRDVQLRPYSTDQTECDEYEFKLDKAPDALDAYFQWLIDQYNAQNKDGRYFTINVNQAADLTRRSLVYFASTSPRSVADAIEDDILGTFGGYLVLRYEDDQLILDLYSDIHEMNEQVIDYGENILDISRSESTDDQYTAVYPIGKTPQYTAEQQKYHDEKDIYDEYMKQRDEAEKAAIAQLKKEEEAEQNRINGMAKGQARRNAENALKKRKDKRQDREKAFSDETKLLQDAQKIKDDKNAADKTKPNPITIESLDNGGYPGDLDIFKEGDVVYSVSYVQRYGYKEFVYSDTDIEDKQLLLALAVAKLKSLLAPSLSIDVRAVDQALYNPKHTHLFAGQAVRVRSKPHKVDEFMMVSSIDLDLIDPSRTTATLGVAYDTLTGQQSSFLRNLNSKIVASVDAVDKLGEDVKVTETTLGRVETVVDKVAADNELIVNTVGDYKWMTDAAWGKAEDARESAEEANRGVTDTNVRIDNLKMETDERIEGMETDISGIHDGINNTKAEIVTIKDNAEQIRQDAQAGIQEAKDKAEVVRTEVNMSIDGLQTKFEQVSDNLIELTDNLDGLINPSFGTNSMYGWTIRPTDKARMSSHDREPGGPYLVIDSSDAVFLATIINDGLLTFAPKHRYRVTVMMKVTSEGYFAGNEGLTIRLAKPNYANMSDWVVGFYANVEKSEIGTTWKSYSKDIVIGEYGATGHLRLAFQPAANANAALAIKSVKIEDITEAQTALIRTSELEQNITGFKQTVEETYTTKDEFNNLQIGGRNLLLNTKTSKQMVGNNGTNQGVTLYTLSTHSWAHLDPGEYMISADISYEGTISGKFTFQRDNKPWGFTPAAGKNFADIITDSKRKAHVEFCVTNAYDGASKGLAVRLDNVQGTVTFSNVKLERGTKATAWSPAPEDMLDVATASTTYTTKSEFTQTAKEIKGTVAEQANTIDGYDKTISTLSLKADKFETDITQVTQQATAIAGRTTKLEQDLGGFKQTVTGDYITKTDADKNLVDAINGMQIGGTNMLLDTRAFGSANPNNIPAHGFSLNSAAQNGTYNQFTYRRIPDTVTTNNPDGPAYNNIPIERGKTYTASFYYRGTADLFVFFHGDNGCVGSVATTASNGFKGTSTNGNDGNVTFAKDSEWKRCWVTWTLHKTGGTQLKKHLLFRRKGTTGYIDIAGVKLEEGTKATEWSPSPFDTLYASNIDKTYAPKTMVEQTEERITQTVEATYATKTQMSDEMRQSLKTFELRGRQDGNYWVKLGRVTMAQHGKDFHIDYTGGRGFNGSTSQNSQLEIHVRSGNGSGTLFAVTLNRLVNADMYTVKAFAVDTTHIDLYMTGGGQYSTGTMAYYGQYSDFSGAKQIDDISTAEGTELKVLEQSLSTKTYVEQKAESVSIGVVEDFKDGKHGDKLTTQSNLTALKDEINLGVKKQYADLSEQIKLANSDNAIGKNFSFESNNFDGWASHDNWEIGSNGSHTGRYYAQNTIPAGSNGNQLISTGSISAEYGHTYKLEYWVKKKPNTQCRGIHRISYKRSGRWEDTPSDVATTIFLDENGTTNITGGRDYFDVTDTWTKVVTYIIPPSNVTDIRVRIIGNNPGSAQTVYAVDDVSLTDYSVAKTINKTMAGISVKADSIVQEVRNDYATKDLVSRSIPGLKNPNFDAYKEGYTAITGWSVLGPWAEKKLGNTSPVSKSEGGTYFAGRSGTTAGQTLELINEGYISAYPGMKVQISWWMFVDANIIQNSNFSAGIIANGVVTRNLLSNYSTGGWKYMTTTVEVPANVNQFRVRFGFVTTGTAGWLRLDSVSVTDVTEAKAALGKATTVEANLENYKITVSDTYVDNDTVKAMQTQWNQTAKGFEASIKASSSSISVVNPGFETGDTTGWTATNFKGITVRDKAIFQNTTHRFLGLRDGSAGYKMPMLVNEGTVTARKNDYIKVSARILFLDGSNNSLGGWMSIGVTNSYSGIVYLGDVDIMSGGWTTVSYNVQVPEDGLYSVRLVFPSDIDESTKILVDDVAMANETEAIHADSRINKLETRIAMTSEGVRVGKIENGTFQGTSALMNSEGSFDILQSEETVATMRSDYVGLMRNSDKYRFGVRPYKEQSTGSVNYTYEGVDLQTVGGFSLNGIPAAPASDILTIRPTQTTGNNYFIKYNVDTLKNDNAIFLNAATLRRDYYQRLDEGKPALAVHFKHAVGLTTTKDGDTNVSNDHIDTQVMAINPCLYGIQFVVNAHKKSTNSYLDATIKVMKTGENTWINSSALPAFRVVEQGDPLGWLTRTSPMYFVKLDVGYRFGVHISGSTNDFTIGGLNKIIITRMPFSGERMK